MSYYIAPQSINIEIGEIVIYRVVKRLSDFKAEDGKRYRVFKSKKQMNELMMVPIYIGKNGKLKKCKDDFALRF